MVPLHREDSRSPGLTRNDRGREGARRAAIPPKLQEKEGWEMHRKRAMLCYAFDSHSLCDMVETVERRLADIFLKELWFMEILSSISIDGIGKQEGALFPTLF